MNLYTRLINKDHPLPPDYVPENLTDIGIPFDAPCGDPKRLLEIRTAHAALMLIQAAQRESLILTGISGYRSYKRQQQPNKTRHAGRDPKSHCNLNLGPSSGFQVNMSTTRTAMPSA